MDKCVTKGRIDGPKVERTGMRVTATFGEQSGCATRKGRVCAQVDISAAQRYNFQARAAESCAGRDAANDDH